MGVSQAVSQREHIRQTEGQLHYEASQQELSNRMAARHAQLIATVDRRNPNRFGGRLCLAAIEVGVVEGIASRRSQLMCVMPTYYGAIAEHWASYTSRALGG